MLTKVENKDGYKTSNQFYYHLKDETGKHYLFSEFQLAVASERADKNKEDLPETKRSNLGLYYFMSGVLAGFVLTFLYCYIF